LHEQGDNERLACRHREAARARNANNVNVPKAEKAFKKVDKELKEATKAANKQWVSGYSLSYWLEREKLEGYSPADVTTSCFARTLFNE